jgi:FixJ family two-component response regulator
MRDYHRHYVVEAIPRTFMLARLRVRSPKRRPKVAHTSIRRTSRMMVPAAATVVVVDDDPSVLNALSRLIRTAGFTVLSFERPSTLLESAIPKTNLCALIDLYLPEMDGSELSNRLAASGRSLPAILITGRDDAAAGRLIAKANPVAVLFKPVDEQTLFEAIARAIALSEN